MTPKVYLTSDQHYNHGRIIDYCNRPFKDVGEMNRVMIERHNARVGHLDTVIMLGDFAMGPTPRWKDFLKVLNGKRKILIRGNHDRNARFMKEVVGFNEVYEELDYDFGEHGIWRLQHYPVKSPKKILHGHVHQHYRRLSKFLINCSVDVWDFYPRKIEELLTAPIDSDEYKCACGKTLKRLDDNKEHYGCYGNRADL